MPGNGQYLHLRLFAEGVEIPVISAQIQSQKNAPAAAAIQIPANDYALDLRPRTLIHLFAFDIYNGVPPEDTVSVGAPGTRVVSREDGVDPEVLGLFPPDRFESTPDQDRTDLINENYKLIFGGEVCGFAFSKSPTSRSITLQCKDWSNYWDIAYQYQVSGYSLGGGGTRAAFTGASTSVFNDFFDGSADIVSQLIAEGPRSYPSLRGTLLGGVVRIIEAIGGVYFGRRAVRGVNDFFSLAEIRLHLTQMVGANPYSDRDERRLMGANGFGSLFRRSLSGLGRLVTIRGVLLALNRYIFHEIIPITSPRYIPPLYDPNIPRYEEVGIEEDEDLRVLARAARNVKTVAEELLERQGRVTDQESARRESDRRGGLARELNAVTRTTRTAATRARNIAIQIGGISTPLPDRLVNIDSVSTLFSNSGSAFNEVVAVLEGRTTGLPVSPGAVSPEETEARASRPSSPRIEMGVAGSIQAAILDQRMEVVIANMQQILDLRVRRRVQRTTQQPDPPPRLLTALYRPDVWMTSPPRCNVIFPELYSQFSFGRDYEREITRMLLRTSSAFFGSDVLFDGFYMSPANVLGARSGRPITTGRDADIDNVDHPLHIRRDLLDHELYTGIIPAFERMTDLNLHALRGGYTEMNGARVAYAELACNHIFFQKRFQSRQLQLAGKFNPYAVLGFPMMVVDRYLPIDAFREGGFNTDLANRLRDILAEGDGIQSNPTTDEQRQIVEANYARINEIVGDILTDRPNTHYLGTPEMISHTLDATSGGNTSIQMGYARTTNERTEFLGDTTGTRARRRRNQRMTNTVAALEPPVVGAVGYRGGNILTVTDVTDEFTRRSVRRRSTDRTATGATRYTSSRTAPLYVANAGFTARARRGTRVVVGVEQPAQSYGPEVVALVGAGGSFDSSTIDRTSWSSTTSTGEGGATRTEVLVTFRAYRIVEEIGAYERASVELPPEFLTFPPWYGDHWRPNQIGGLYAYFFGTGAITDPLFVRAGSADSSRADPAAATPTTESEADAARRGRTLSIDFVTRVGDAREITTGALDGADAAPPPGDSTPTTLMGGEVAGPPATSEPTPEDERVDSEIGRIGVRSPIALAAEEVVRIYSQIKLNKFDVHAFLRAYTWRPVASMVDLFGTANLEINDQGTVTRGVEGFHSRAFGDFDDLRQLVGPGDGTRPRTILGLAVDDPDETGDDSRAARSSPIAARLDTRKEKREAVLRYLLYLGASCGVLG